MHRVQIATGYNQITLTNGLTYKAGDQADLTDTEFGELRPALFTNGVLVDLGLVNSADIPQQTTAPASPTTGTLWIDTSTTPAIIKRFNGSTWDSLSTAGAAPALMVPTSKTTDYTLALTDANTIIEVNSATNHNIIVPLDSQVAFPIGTTVEIARVGTGRVKVLPYGHNYILNPSVETNLTGWSARNGTIAQAASAALYGTNGVRTTTTAASGSIGWFYTPNVTIASLGLQVGDTVSARVDVVATTIAAGARLQLRFRVGNTTISTVAGNFTTAGVSKIEAQTIPANCDNVQLILDATATAIGQTIDTDGLMLVAGATAPATYVDGAVSGYSWTGTAHASTSQGPTVRSTGLSVPVNGSVRLRKRAVNDWVVGDAPLSETVLTTQTFIVDRDIGQPGIVAPWSPFATATTLALTANTAYLARFVPSRPMTIVKIAYRVATASGSNDPVDIGIFDASLTKIGSSGAVTSQLNSTGTKVITLSLGGLAPGSVYYAALAANSTATLAACTFPGNGFGTTFPLLDMASLATQYPLPTSLASATATDTVPMLWLREV